MYVRMDTCPENEYKHILQVCTHFHDMSGPAYKAQSTPDWAHEKMYGLDHTDTFWYRLQIPILPCTSLANCWTSVGFLQNVCHTTV